MLIGYRCKVCGAPVDPEVGYCKYCDTVNFKPIINGSKRVEKPRIIVRDGSDEVEINPTEIKLSMETTPMIEITSLADTERRFIAGCVTPQYARFSATAHITNTAINILYRPIFNVVFTGFKKGYAHEFRAYMQNMETTIEMNAIAEMTFDIVSVNPVDLWNTRKIHNAITEGMRCPICGAPLDPEKSKCDYCGYWWLYSPEGV